MRRLLLAAAILAMPTAIPTSVHAQNAGPGWFQIYDKIDGYDLYMHAYKIVDGHPTAILAHVPVTVTGAPDYSHADIWLYISACDRSGAMFDTGLKGTSQPVNGVVTEDLIRHDIAIAKWQSEASNWVTPVISSRICPHQ
jgi:hypothetical protein